MRDSYETHRLAWDGAVDAEHFDAAVIYTTTGLLWEGELDKPAVSQAYTAGMFPDDTRRAFLGDNCRQLFKITA